MSFTSTFDFNCPAYPDDDRDDDLDVPDVQFGDVVTAPGFEKIVSFAKPQTTVTFIVDTEDIKQTFLVHKNVACAHSPFFKAAFESDMIEGMTQSMGLEDGEADVFGRLVDWLYNKEVNGADPFDKKNKVDDVVTLAKLWKLAERTLMPNLQNATVQKICSEIRRTPLEEFIKLCRIVFKDKEDNALKKFVVYVAAIQLSDDNFSFIVGRLPAAMSDDM
ncbi:hypothetical protein IFR05_015307 [Cadophora sp. M221]|nr:hypothetical protein IFR05_015307 [Cadophora sp. M221]